MLVWPARLWSRRRRPLVPLQLDG